MPSGRAATTPSKQLFLISELALYRQCPCWVVRCYMSRAIVLRDTAPLRWFQWCIDPAIHAELFGYSVQYKRSVVVSRVGYTAMLCRAFQPTLQACSWRILDHYQPECCLAFLGQISVEINRMGLSGNNVVLSRPAPWVINIQYA